MMGNKSKNKEAKVAITVTNRTVIRVLLLVIASIIALAALKRAEHSLVLIFTAIFLAFALNAPIHWVASQLPGKLRGSRSLATSVSFLLVVLLVAIFVLTIVPPLVRQTENFVSVAPTLVEESSGQGSPLGKIINK